MDENGQVSAELILLIGVLLVIVIVAGVFIVDITKSIAGNITQVVDTARNNAINKI
ncbi:MAG: class III signal peptide-containing protein [Methanobacteriales archaeon Met13]